MTSWRLEATVLTDLSASIFAVCFMVLLMFLGAARNAPPAAPVETARIEATTALKLLKRHPDGAAGMVDLLYRHGRPGVGPGIDLFADRIEVTTEEDPSPAILRGAAVAELAALLRTASGKPARLYVFANEHYGAVATVLQSAGLSWQELSVPRGLRDAQADGTAWSSAFEALARTAPDPAAFRQGLAVLLAGTAETTQRARGADTPGSGDAAPAVPSAIPTIAEFWQAQWEAFARRLGLLLPLLGAAGAVLIRLRYPDRPVLASGDEADLLS